MNSVCPLIGQAAAGALRASGKAPVVAHERRHFTPTCCPPPCRYYGPVRELFRTTLGQVYLARNKESGQQVVIKMIERGPAVSKHVETELLIHRQVPPGGGGCPAARWLAPMCLLLCCSQADEGNSRDAARPACWGGCRRSQTSEPLPLSQPSAQR
jgi:hypothetical protein